ncbi:MAG: hypothetical protein CR986_10135 [Ignavibacteriae bacterium]|nr:MAG: hypothetical protein CR986_10135 [Ignavibacteriota bacterium]
MKTKKYLLILLSILLFTNCSSTYFSLKPDEESKLNQGRRIIEKDSDNLFTALILEDITENSYVFYLYVENKSSEEILVDPGKIYMNSYDSKKKLLKSRKIFAVDPEQQLNKIAKAIDIRKDEHKVSTGVNIAFSLLNTVIDLSDDNDESPAKEVLDNAIIFTDRQINEEISYESDIDYLKSEKEHWKNNVLRKTELYKDESIDGIFYMPINPFAKFIKIIVPIGKTKHSFKFKQIKTTR